MPKEEWGVKRICPSCAVRFYDLQRDPMICPSCGHSVSIASLTSGKGRTLVADKSDAKSAPVDDDDDVVIDDDDTLDDDDDLDVVLDDDDDDDVSLDDLTDVAADDDEL